MAFGEKILIFLFTIILIHSSSSYETLLEPLESGCEPTGILCRTSTTFTFCTRIGTDVLYIVKEFSCPEGYFCSDQTNFPCISADQTTQDITTTEEITEIITEGSSTSTSTKKPVQPPNCISKGKHPGPTCSQYYECVSEFFWYTAVLRNCPEGLYFNLSTRNCDEASISECTDN